MGYGPRTDTPAAASNGNLFLNFFKILSEQYFRPSCMTSPSSFSECMLCVSTLSRYFLDGLGGGNRFLKLCRNQVWNRIGHLQ
jgi:hypothetical protein